MEFKPSFAIQSIFKIEFDDELNEIIRTYERNSEKLFYNSLKPKCIKIFNKSLFCFIHLLCILKYF